MLIFYVARVFCAILIAVSPGAFAASNANPPASSAGASCNPVSCQTSEGCKADVVRHAIQQGKGLIRELAVDVSRQCFQEVACPVGASSECKQGADSLYAMAKTRIMMDGLANAVKAANQGLSSVLDDEQRMSLSRLNEMIKVIQTRMSYHVAYSKRFLAGRMKAPVAAPSGATP